MAHLLPLFDSEHPHSQPHFVTRWPFVTAVSTIYFYARVPPASISLVRFYYPHCPFQFSTGLVRLHCLPLLSVFHCPFLLSFCFVRKVTSISNCSFLYPLIQTNFKYYENCFLHKRHIK